MNDRRLMWLVSACTLVACTDVQTTLTLDAEGTVRELAQDLDLRVCGGSGTLAWQQVVRFNGESADGTALANWPLSLAFVPGDGQGSRRFRFEASLADATGTLRTALLAYGGFDGSGSGKRHVLRFEQLCVDRLCAGNATCEGGVCVEPKALSTTLTEAEPALPACTADASCQGCCANEACSFGVCRAGQGVASVSLGENNGCAFVSVKSRNELWCWGRNEQGQLRLGKAGDEALVPVKVADEAGTLAIAFGASHACEVQTDSAIRCWGSNFDGQCGKASGDAAILEPYALPFDSDGVRRGWRQVTTGFSHSCSIKEDDNSTFCWGDNDDCQLGVEGNDRAEPVRLVDRLHATIATGPEHTCAIGEARNGVWCWGHRGSGRLGSTSVPAAVRGAGSCSLLRVAFPEGDRSWQNLALGEAHSCVLSFDGELWCWGDNRQGQLGLASEDAERNTATQSVALPAGVRGKRWSMITAGRFHTCARTDDAADPLFCWGSNQKGQLGLAASIDKARAPTAVPAPWRWQKVAAAGERTCAISQDGGLWCWGFGALGIGQNGPAYTPQRVCLPASTNL